MRRDEFVAWLSDTLVVPVDRLTPDASLTNLGWDSLASINLTVMAEERWGAVVKEEDFRGVATVGDLVNYFNSHFSD